MNKSNENIPEAVYFQAAQSYCIIFWADGRKLVKPKPIKHFAATLEANGWCRIHRTYMVNPAYVNFITSDRENICLNNGQELPISRRKLRSVLKWRKQIN
jgi:two-component system, LytTR family, response regulator